ncbi:MAG: UDP-N-acetylmuramoylalanine-D-glutamate ligase [Candidatus Moranbacteria bacterium GW2011_GWA2_39_41]|nr:MAG: UDP-N-acetylmuramoylalanine-D-glutamate ligase [Candidatus Moranbacteria bacterium GW2011_GWA2_39_41]
MNISDLDGKKITVMGLGLHGGGVGTVRFLHAAGAILTVTDMKSEAQLQPSLEKLKELQNIKYVLGRHEVEDFSQADMIVKTPPVPWTNEFIKIALEKNIPVEIDSSLFFKLCPNQIIGVTGTRGKTTTASLIYEILKTAGKNPMKVGIGQISVLDKLNELQADSIVVFELSSWRLSALGCHKLSPKIAVVTNIYPDHLNYYASMKEYVADKKNIFLNQSADDICVLNWDNEMVREFEKEIPAKIIKISITEKPDGMTVFLRDGQIVIRNETDEKNILAIAEIKIKGEHNLANILAAVAVAHGMGIEDANIAKAIVEFSGLPHRLEFVKEIDGVKYYNDTAATSPEGAIAGINSFSEKIVLIAGGSDKNLDMTQLAKEIHEKVMAVVFLAGAATDKIISAMQMQDSKQDFIIANSMLDAVVEARKLASAGEVVLLSPGSASFGLFLNEFDRGDKFKEAVEIVK